MAGSCCYISFILNVTGLLDPTLKCIDEFRLIQENTPSAIYIFKVSEKTLEYVRYIQSKQ